MKGMFVVIASAMMLLSTNTFAQRPRPWYRGNVREIIRQLETDTDAFKSSLDSALDRSSLNGSRAEDEINAYVKQFEEATDRLRDRSEDQQSQPIVKRLLFKLEVVVHKRHKLSHKGHKSTFYH